MNDDDVWGGEMPNLPFRRRHGDPADAPQLDELLDAGRLDASAAPEWQSVSDVLRSAAAAAEPSELAGEAAVMATFRRERVGIRHRRPQPIARCKSMFSTLLTGRIAVGLAAGVVTVTGAATAAYACVLPSPIQSFAHTTIGAPKPSGPKLVAVSAVDAITSSHVSDPSVSPSVTLSPSVAVSASASASASALALANKDKGKSFVVDPTVAAAVQALIVYRACQEYAVVTKDGKTLDPKALALLTKAAGSASAIAAYCAALPIPPKFCMAAPQSMVTATVSPTVSPSPKTDKDTGNNGNNGNGDWWRWCGICPAVTATSTASATATATTDADGDNDGSGTPRQLPWFWCGDRDPKGNHSGDPSKSVQPLPKLDPKPTVPFHDNGFGGFGFGANDNHGGSFGQSGEGSGQQHH
jgi:hypothetical protein